MSGLLIHSPADILRRALITLGLGTDPPDTDWPIFVSSTPWSPDNLITVYDTDGRQDGRSMIDGLRYEHHGIRIQIRALTEVVGYPKSRAVAVALDQSIYDQTVTISSSSYLVRCATRTGDVVRAGKETGTSKRSLYNISAILDIQPLN